MLWLGWARQARVIGFSIAGSLLLATGAWAQVTFKVNSTDDGVDANVMDGKCEIPPPAPPGTCTLRAAVMQANRMPGAGAIIQLPPGPYKLSIPASIADGEENGDLNLIVPAGYAPGPTVITGPGAATTIIDAQGIDRVLRIDAGRSATITGVSFINGLVPVSASGGGLYNQGSLVLSDCIVSHNTAFIGNGGGIFNQGFLGATRVTLNDNATDSYGGGIYNADHLELSQSSLSANKGYGGAGIYNVSSYSPYSQVDSTEITGNIASAYGGGIANIYGTTSLNITRSTVSNNTAGTHGGGVYNGGLLYADNSTISGNFAKTDGGGFYNNASGNSNIYNSTMVFNLADSDGNANGQGGGVYIVLGSIFNVRDTVVAGNARSNATSYDDCAGGTLGSYGRNQFFDFNIAGICTIIQGVPGDYSLVANLNELGPLQDNGGPTRTHALVPPSSMIGGGLACFDQHGGHLVIDQRGKPRPPSPSDPFKSTCDIGAFEYNEIFPNSFE
jgi:trimeric autotransporter adhesin